MADRHRWAACQAARRGPKIPGKGRARHNGVALCGTPAASVVAAAVMARIAEAAILACHKTDMDTFCGNYCRQVWPEDASDAGTDASRPSLVTLTFCKKVTSRRQWFEDLARAVASPMGVEVAANRADGCCDRTGHNGVALCGTPAVSVVAAVWLPLLLLFLLPLLLLLLLLSYNYYCHHYHHDF